MIKHLWFAYIVMIIVGSEITNSWKYDRHPKLYGENLKFRYISPRNKRVQKRIVMLHDFFRTKVNPPASNMLSMVRKDAIIKIQYCYLNQKMCGSIKVEVSFSIKLVTVVNCDVSIDRFILKFTPV